MFATFREFLSLAYYSNGGILIGNASAVAFVRNTLCALSYIIKCWQIQAVYNSYCCNIQHNLQQTNIMSSTFKAIAHSNII
jgi:hypothetical protein